MRTWNQASFSARCPDNDLLTTVIGSHGVPYRCPDISSVDGHILELSKRIRCAAPRFPRLVVEFWADIDLLLDRRMWLAFDPESRAATTPQIINDRGDQSYRGRQPASPHRA